MRRSSINRWTQWPARDRGPDDFLAAERAMSERAAATVIAVVGSHALYVSQPVSARNILSLRRRNMVPVLHQINLFVRSDGTRARPAEHGGWATVQVREPVTRLP